MALAALVALSAVGAPISGLARAAGEYQLHITGVRRAQSAEVQLQEVQLFDKRGKQLFASRVANPGGRSPMS